MEVRAIQAAINVGQLVIHIADLEVAPLTVVVTVGETHIEFTHARRHLFDRTVITEGRIEIVRIDAAEQGGRRLLHEVAEQGIDRSLARIGTGGQFPVLAKLAVDEECQAAVNVRLEVVIAVLALQQISRSIDRVLGDRQVGHANVEPIVLFQLEVTQVKLAGAFGIQHRHFDGVRAVRQDFFTDEAARLINRDRTTRYPDLMVFRHTGTAHIDGATRQANVVQAETIFAVGLQEFRIRLRPGFFKFVRFDGVRLVVNDPQRLRLRLVEIAVLAVSAHYVTELLMRCINAVRIWRPGRGMFEIYRYYIQRL